MVQRGLVLVKQEEEAHAARLQAIRDDLDRRAAGESLTLDEMDAELAAWRDARDAADVA